MRLSGSYFDLTDRFAPNAVASSNPGGVKHGSGTPGNEPSVAPGIVISVAKRLVPSAVRRNTVKRIVRQAWRAALGDDGRTRFESVCGTTFVSAGKQASDGTSGSDRKAEQESAPTRSVGPVRVCLVRLKRYPGTVVKSKSRAKAGEAADATPPGLAAIKRELRADADRLFAAFLQARAQRPARAGPMPANESMKPSR